MHGECDHQQAVRQRVCARRNVAGGNGGGGALGCGSDGFRLLIGGLDLTSALDLMGAIQQAARVVGVFCSDDCPNLTAIKSWMNRRRFGSPFAPPSAPPHVEPPSQRMARRLRRLWGIRSIFQMEQVDERDMQGGASSGSSPWWRKFVPI